LLEATLQERLDNTAEQGKANVTSRLIEKYRSQYAEIAEENITRDVLLGSQETAGVIIRDLYGYISDVNEVILQMLEATDKTELVGKHVLNFTFKGDKERVFKDSIKMIMEDTGRKNFFCATTKNGKVISCEMTTDLIKDKDGEKIGFVDTIRCLPCPKEKL
jgi:PAS domain S-box-containing protein